MRSRKQNLETLTPVVAGELASQAQRDLHACVWRTRCVLWARTRLAPGATSGLLRVGRAWIRMDHT